MISHTQDGSQDTDGKQYYMDEDRYYADRLDRCIGKKRYYIDMDGILQTGVVTNR